MHRIENTVWDQPSSPIGEQLLSAVARGSPVKARLAGLFTEEIKPKKAKAAASGKGGEACGDREGCSAGVLDPVSTSTSTLPALSTGAPGACIALDLAHKRARAPASICVSSAASLAWLAPRSPLFPPFFLRRRGRAT